jgi:hypothetical protein
VERAAAPLLLRQHDAAAIAAQHPDRGIVDIRERGGHNAPGQQGDRPLRLGRVEHLALGDGEAVADPGEQPLHLVEPKRPEHPKPPGERLGAAALVEPHQA